MKAHDVGCLRELKTVIIVKGNPRQSWILTQFHAVDSGFQVID